jgi:hypothetical protein
MRRLLDHLVGEREKRRRNVKAARDADRAVEGDLASGCA